ncbi:MAG: helix-turn-helix domain-containing protein [Chloroflexota bacterium]|nr:helix-turn-helix domain-containing protein [Chloroflexota bacterium]
MHIDTSDACSPGPYLELFARHPKPGWTVCGDEAGSSDEPRGKAHRGYGGGPIQTPLLPPHARIKDATADYLGTELRREYESGKSIRDISVETSYSIGRVRSLLQRADTPIRSRGALPSTPNGTSSEEPAKEWVYDTK